MRLQFTFLTPFDLLHVPADSQIQCSFPEWDLCWHFLLPLGKATTVCWKFVSHILQLFQYWLLKWLDLTGSEILNWLLRFWGQVCVCVSVCDWVCCVCFHCLCLMWVSNFRRSIAILWISVSSKSKTHRLEVIWITWRIFVATVLKSLCQWNNGLANTVVNTKYRLHSNSLVLIIEEFWTMIWYYCNFICIWKWPLIIWVYF